MREKNEVEGTVRFEVLTNRKLVFLTEIKKTKKSRFREENNWKFVLEHVMMKPTDLQVEMSSSWIRVSKVRIINPVGYLTVESIICRCYLMTGWGQ